MLFRKIEKSCSYCAHALKIGENVMGCKKKGPVPADGACRRFRYDPLKRVPEAPEAEAPMSDEEADYSL